MQRYGKDGRDRSLNTRRDDLEGALSLILVQLQGAARGLGEEKVKVVGAHDLEMRPVIPAGSSENKAVRGAGLSDGSCPAPLGPLPALVSLPQRPFSTGPTRAAWCQLQTHVTSTVHFPRICSPTRDRGYLLFLYVLAIFCLFFSFFPFLSFCC